MTTDPQKTQAVRDRPVLTSVGELKTLHLPPVRQGVHCHRHNTAQPAAQGSEGQLDPKIRSGQVLYRGAVQVGPLAKVLTAATAVGYSDWTTA